MRRKTSTLPTRIYKYFVKAPSSPATAEVLDAAFRSADAHYDRLITIERTRRASYRELRSRMFPDLAGLEGEYARLQAECSAAAAAIRARKSATRSRAVDPDLKARLAELRGEARNVLVLLKRARDAADSSHDLRDGSVLIDTAARDAVKALRPGTYWGTYLLCEAAALAASRSKKDPGYPRGPARLRKSRIGVHFAGGVSPADLETDTRMQLSPMGRTHNGAGRALGEKRRSMEKLLKFRVGSNPDRSPRWVELPVLMHRPLPEDSRIKDAYLTRRPGSVTVPWRYALCIVLESATFVPTPGVETRSARAAVNFGWLSVDGGLRVAMVNSDTGLREVRIPADVVGRVRKSEELRGLCDEKHNVARAFLADWIRSNPDLGPEGFRETFTGVGRWRSQHELAEWVWYWKEHRFAGDEVVFSVMDEWRRKYRHLMKWAQDEQAYVQRWRDDLYRCEAKRLATTHSRVVVDDFDMSEVSRRPRADQVARGGQAARHNMVIAAPGDLRTKIVEACRTYGCELEVVEAANGTRRCNVCGTLQDVPKVDHRCVGCGASWDRDVNNTDNLLERSSVVPISDNNGPGT